MKAQDVLACLQSQYPDDRYCTVLEAPLDAGRQGTKIDLLAIGLWSSLEFLLDAVEVKVSLGDFRNEVERRRWVVRDANGREVHSPRTRADGELLLDPDSWLGSAYRRHIDVPAEPWTLEREVLEDYGKSREWREVAHRFWIACPLPLAQKVEPLLPDGWGLYACAGGRTQVVRRATVNYQARPLSWRESIGLIRASADAGAANRARAFDKGAQAARKVEGLEPLSQSQLWRLPGRPL